MVKKSHSGGFIKEIKAQQTNYARTKATVAQQNKYKQHTFHVDTYTLTPLGRTTVSIKRSGKSSGVADADR